MRRNSHSIAPIFAENIGGFSKLKIIGLNQRSLNKAQAIISSMNGYISHQLQKCEENQGRYLLLVNWETLKDHTEGFRYSLEYQQWKSLLHHYYEPFPTVEHYKEVTLSRT